MAERYRYELESVGNPFDPFDQRESWYNYEKIYGFDAPAFLARFAFTNDDELADRLNEEEKNEAITRAIVADPCNIYRRVRKLVSDTQASDTQ